MQHSDFKHNMGIVFGEIGDNEVRLNQVIDGD